MSFFCRSTSRARAKGLSCPCRRRSSAFLAGSTCAAADARLGISALTVHTHLKNVYAKLHVHGRGEAVAKYLTGMDKT